MKTLYTAIADRFLDDMNTSAMEYFPTEGAHYEGIYDWLYGWLTDYSYDYF